MPIYEYECTKCGHYLEALQKIADKPLRECPECGKHSLKRLVSAPMFRLSGSGWYETDFKSDSETKRNLADKGDKEAPAADAKAETSSGDKSEAKPAEAKPDSKPDSKPDAKLSPAGGSKPERTRTMITKPTVSPSAPARARRAQVRKTAARRGKR